jgi:hypothetical protein
VTRTVFPGSLLPVTHPCGLVRFQWAGMEGGSAVQCGQVTVQCSVGRLQLADLGRCPGNHWLFARRAAGRAPDTRQ